MANTITSKVIGSGSDNKLHYHIHIASDGTNETDTVLYDNSAYVNNTALGRLLHLRVWGQTTTAAVLIFEWDQSTDAEILRVTPTGSPICIDFRKTGGGGNPNAAGATGDLILT